MLKASVIIPAYNSRERLYLNLLALNNQEYEQKDVEVIVVDNGSTDDTFEMLSDFNLKYPFTKVRVDINQGIAFARNEGIKRAKGDILIFHDSDMIASKDFITKHISSHVEKSLVVCGVPWKRMYSFYYDKFSDSQVEKFNEIANLAGNKWDVNKLSDGCQLVDENIVTSFKLDKYIFDLDSIFIKKLKEILKRYGSGLKNYYFPWRFFITNNASVERRKVLEVGMFDSKIKKYGYEDYDLGIRLYKAGCKFKFAEDILNIHQEHPPNHTDIDINENINYMCKKYNNISSIDVIMMCISHTLSVDGYTLNKIAGEINKIISLKNYDFVLKLFLKFLQFNRKGKINGKKRTRIHSYMQKNVKTLRKQVFELKHIHEINDFIIQLHKLSKQLLNIDIKKMLKEYSES
ncbi:glycosyltransferase family 2 protein [Herbivorax sp. ANBcel31]|uniref:glycosyltransferase family 2 protein n=1 Tax=Herbivorax sp. ANBcel31 TaxID=3069754 RepID=UPI0027B47395|nr:glycosyltransferase family 2 protein [Herbivorax sp. ANBcel31]MDQ2087561.1 glycosyltransferase family 2 protein [Herbivorax sp. ANBcel31]